MANLKDIGYGVGKYLTASDSSGIPDIGTNRKNLDLLNFKVATNNAYSLYNFKDGMIDAYQTETGVDTSGSTALTYDSTSKYYTTRENAVAFEYTGSAQTYTVPAGKTSLVFKVWAPGGGGDSSDEIGGGGGFAGATIPVTAAEVLHITVGGGGSRGLYGGSAGGGGGYSGIFRTSVTQGNALLIAGGGGGAGDRGTGGAGGGTSGTQGSPSTGGGGAGTDSAGGAAGSPANGSPTAGGALTGGNGGQPGGSGPSPGGFGGGGYGGSEPGGSMGGGGGGSGYYGGGGGSGAMPSGGTGGGGSGFSAAPNTSDTLTAGSGQTGANQSDSDYSPGTGDGGGGGVDGEHGYVVIPGATNNMTLLSNTQTAQAVPTEGRLILYEEDIDSITLNTDLKGYVSRDNGTTYTQTTLGLDSNITHPTSLLLHCDGSNDGTTFTDSSYWNHVATVGGNTHTDTAVKKFGTASAQFDGTGDYLDFDTSSKFGFGTGDWTIDFWVYASASGFGSYAYAFDFRTDGNLVGQPYLFFDTGNSNVPGYTEGSGTTRCSSNVAMVNETWYHIAVVKYSNVTKVYTNGVTGASGTYNTEFADTVDYRTTNPLRLAHRRNGTNALNGYLDEFRITKGIARWTANFTPDTSPYTGTEGNQRLLSGSVDISGQPSGTNMKYKVETLNNKNLNLHGASLLWA